MTTHNETVDKGSTAREKGGNLWRNFRLEPPTDIPACLSLPWNTIGEQAASGELAAFRQVGSMKVLTSELRQELVDIFEYADVDDMHMAEAARRFLDDYPQTIGLTELLEFINEELSKWLDVPEKLLSLLGLHDRIEVHLGQALHATQYRLLKPELELACSTELGVRVITAVASKDSEILKLTAVDPCYLVRFASYENMHSSKPQMEYLVKDDTYFREFSGSEREELGDDFEEIATLESCSCSADEINDFIHNKYDDALLNLPPIAHEFEKRMRYFGGLDFGTQPLPGPMEDYLFLDILEYLKGPVPDQYVVNHAGHGVNSYSLNFRYALGDLAVLMQVGYGGAYGDQEDEAKRWDECVNHIGDIMLLNPENRQEGLWQRKYLLLYSNFRFEQHLRFFALRDKEWVELPLVASWEDAKEFFSFWAESDSISS